MKKETLIKYFQLNNISLDIPNNKGELFDFVFNIFNSPTGYIGSIIYINRGQELSENNQIDRYEKLTIENIPRNLIINNQYFAFYTGNVNRAQEKLYHKDWILFEPQYISDQIKPLIRNEKIDNILD